MRRTSMLSCAGPRGQAGKSFIGLMFMLVLAALFMISTLKLAPHYYNSYVVSQAVEKVLSEEAVSDLSTVDIQELIRKELYVNRVESVDVDDILIQRSGNELVILVEYEAREHLIFNLDIVPYFRHQFEYVSD